MKKFLSTCLYTPRALNDFTACPNAENRKEKARIVEPMENSESAGGVKFALPLKVQRTQVILVQPQGWKLALTSVGFQFFRTLSAEPSLYLTMLMPWVGLECWRPLMSK